MSPLTIREWTRVIRKLLSGQEKNDNNKQTVVSKIPQRNPQIEKYEPHKQQWWTQVLRKENQFLDGNETIGYFYISL